jgi:hypothetical protein
MYLETQKMLHHFKSLGSVFKKYSLSAKLNCHTFEIPIQGDHLIYLFPQFMKVKDNQREYTTQFSLDVKYFMGWRPSKAVPVLAMKDFLMWKEKLNRHGLCIPAYSIDPHTPLTKIIVKTFNAFIHPSDESWTPLQSSSAYTLKPEIGEYFEAFIYGTFFKVWYWLDKPVCVEIQKMLKSKVGFYRSKTTRGFLLSDHDFDLQPVLEKLGVITWEWLKNLGHSNLAYTIDAIWSEQDELWIHDMDIHSWIHPYLYPEIIQTMICLNPAVGHDGNCAYGLPSDPV